MGCQLNENDSEKISGITEKLGYTKTEKVEEADLVICLLYTSRCV